MLNIYNRLVTAWAPLILVLFAVLCAGAAWKAREFDLDASSDSLLLEGDADLRYFEQVHQTYTSTPYLVITWTPKVDLLAPGSLEPLKQLSTELMTLDGVKSVNSILNAPLFHSPKVSWLKLASGYKTLLKPDVDLDLAHQELVQSPMYRNLLISPDGKTCALQVNLFGDDRLEALTIERGDLRFKRAHEGLTPEEQSHLAAVEKEYRERHTQQTQQRDRDVASVRRIMGNYRDHAQMYLGGVPMIVSDMITFARNDIKIFGIGVLLFLFLTLAVIFRRPAWVLIPLTACVITGLIMLGLLGALDWRATVISSNFICLLFIITMSMAIHFVVRYRELSVEKSDATHRDLVAQAARAVAVPCLYCAMTTMVGFGSLVVSGIRPVIDFGLMMTIGLAVAYIVCFLFIPAAATLWKPGPTTAPANSKRPSITHMLAEMTINRGPVVAAAALILALLGGLGVSRLTVENRFIDYFKQDTEIYRGMKLIDKSLGGTTPLEIIINGEGDNYWFKKDNLATLERIHTYLEGLPETGKVLSLHTMVQVVEGILNGKINNFILGMLRTFLPEDLKREVLSPFATENFDQTRISLRITESYDGLQREALIHKIETHLTDEIGLKPDQFRLTGMYILYNNLLQSLFKSQILTLGMVFLATWLMFCILFRSIKLATIAIIPNMFPVIVVLGAMGLLGIPLDMMTITIAAITIGIAVDHTIHYVHRFKAEFSRQGSYRDTLYFCHAGIGQAMTYTSVTIIAGFSILMLSNFIPTIYFGLFTSLAMIIALLAAMTLLPLLILTLKPLGPETKT